MKARGLVLILTMAACQTEAPEAGSDLPEGQVRATLMASESGIRYADLDTPDALPSGPPGIFSVKGGYAIPDNVRGKITLLNRDFGMAREIDVSAHAQGILAVAQDRDDLVALDGYAQTPKLLRISADGSIRSNEIPSVSRAAPTGLVRDEVGQMLEYEGGDLLYRVTDLGTSLQMTPSDGYVWNGTRFSVEAPKGAFVHERTVHIGGSSGTVRVPNLLGSVRLIGPDQNGGVYVLVEDVAFADTISVEQSVWHFSSSGEALSVAKVPLQERLTGVQQGIALDKNAEPIALVTKRDALQLWSLTQTNSSAITARVANQLPGEANNSLGATTQGLTTYNGTCLTSNQMMSNCTEYSIVSLNMTSDNVNNNGTCTSRTKPNYLVVGTNTSVSYDWGGWDTPTAFISAINGGGKAGNLNTSIALTCSYGVDCSGFVTRVWGLTDWKRNTSDFSNSNTSKGPAYGPGYYAGDAFALSGVHVCLYAGPGSSGFYLWESAGEPYGRVVNRWSDWSYVSGYSSWRSRTSCN